MKIPGAGLDARKLHFLGGLGMGAEETDLRTTGQRRELFSRKDPRNPRDSVDLSVPEDITSSLRRMKDSGPES